MNMLATGRMVDYTQYRQAFTAAPAAPVHWAWSAIHEAIAQADKAERGSLTLSTTGDATGCELLPGMAITVQVVPAGGRTRPHTHSWWHLFFVHQGAGQVVLDEGESADTRALARGDLLLVPAWVAHQFESRGEGDLVLLSMSNLPQQAALANHKAVEP